MLPLGLWLIIMPQENRAWVTYLLFCSRPKDIGEAKVVTILEAKRNDNVVHPITIKESYHKSYKNIDCLADVEYLSDSSDKSFPMDDLGNRTEVNLRGGSDKTYVIDDDTNHVYQFKFQGVVVISRKTTI